MLSLSKTLKHKIEEKIHTMTMMVKIVMFKIIINVCENSNDGLFTQQGSVVTDVAYFLLKFMSCTVVIFTFYV